MTNCNTTGASRRMSRASSPTLSDVSVFSVFSRSPSPVPDYETLLLRPQHAKVVGGFGVASETLRGTDGRSASRIPKRARSPVAEMSPKKLRIGPPHHSYSPQSPKSPKSPRTPGNRLAGEDGYGTLEVLPKEIRQAIYGHAFDIDLPVTVRNCCGLGTTKREQDACKKHGLGTIPRTGRFNILQVSNAIKEEASWVLFNQSSILINANDSITPYLAGYRSPSLLQLSTSMQHDQRIVEMWMSVTKFKFVHIQILEKQLRWEDPGHPPSSLTPHFVTINLITLFSEIFPFNTGDIALTKRAEEIYRRRGTVRHVSMTDWKKMRSDSIFHLKRLVATVGKYGGLPRWVFLAHTYLDEEDEHRGGAAQLHAFQRDCAENGLAFESSG
ncbi:hypothetical protein P153DRAFT_387983 [Dothidotthia symphoricarpi CBS 119687]|uniref:F-box domain-containing protein n=1 Tax=Dothidotthia symphoricarpi CBS 119687 TaxID=1392245 RepID=A0A6A6A8P4_9PLEO|nr:uncharacterized protein P153DRAFT_387983 [Dothidotthia symphoricarpi CBS 119687]KAF2127444.1 hypothetical protein P153DRAFT_387983 [Dothidotthia symphoricarpi CBS 119687]